MYRITVHYASGGFSSSCADNLADLLRHAYNVYTESDNYNRRIVSRVEIHKKNARGGWELVAV